jgi:hypothetical protein
MFKRLIAKIDQFDFLLTILVNKFAKIAVNALSYRWQVLSLGVCFF